jgi:hypothetical protein
MHTITVPRLAGTRRQAVELCANLPNDLRGQTVKVDVRSTESEGQAFCDELVKQLAVDRGATVRVSGGTFRMTRYTNDAAAIRQVVSLVSIV